MSSRILLHCENGQRWQEVHDFSLVRIEVDFSRVTLVRLLTSDGRRVARMLVRCPYCSALAYHMRRHEPYYLQRKGVAHNRRRPRVWR